MSSNRPSEKGKVIEAILDCINDGVFTVDHEWIVTSFNPAAEKITGIGSKEAIGRPCCEVFRANICENDCALRRTLETGKSIVNQHVYIMTAAGKRIPISISTAPLRDEKGGLLGGVETFRDLTLVEELRKQLRNQYVFADMLSRNHRMHQIFSILPQIAESESTILLGGESGTGKELVARAIHSLSRRKHGPFVAVNCGALPDTLLESELFGYMAGAFTDAKKDKPGRFALAEGGTIFLDEIGDISAALQVRLLRVLQEKEFDPLGSTGPVKANVRVITASNKNIADLVKEGIFRDDLYYRLNVVQIVLPPLRDRKEDVPLLAELFIDRLNKIQGKDVSGISEEALSDLMRHNWPGNVRELQNVIEHAFILCRSGLIGAEHLPDSIAPSGAKRTSLPARTLAESEARFIEDALVRNSYKRLATARALDIDKTTLWRKIKKLGIKCPAEDPE
jgi:PAS domain S-box-containing protein